MRLVVPPNTMSADLIILGAGGSSREILGAAEDINRREPQWRVLGFLDDNPALLGKTVDGLPVLGPLAAAREHTAQLIVGIASWRKPGARRDVVLRLGLPRERYATVIHPSASINSRVTIASAAIITGGVRLRAGCYLGAGCTIMNGVTVNEGALVGIGSVVMIDVPAGVTVSGYPARSIPQMKRS